MTYEKKNKLTFNEWAFEQVVIKGFDIDSVKDTKGKNFKWVNRQNGDEYILNEDR